MKREQDTPKGMVTQFLRELGEPVSKAQIEHSTAQVLESLRAGDSERLIPALASAPPAHVSAWRTIAAVVAVLLIGGALQLALIQPLENDNILAKTAGGKAYKQGEVIRAGTNPEVLVLTDGSRIEMNPTAVVSFRRDQDGTHVYLSQGHVIVMAAIQRSGHLYVETKDCVVSVEGTVFSVSAAPWGSRVSVIEGEVQVRRGEKVQTLLPGQQVSTGSVKDPVPVKADIEWSRNAPELVALLQQSTPAAPTSTPQNQTGTVTGNITRQGTSEGIAEVAINLCPDENLMELTSVGPGIVRASFAAAFFLGAEGYRCHTIVRATTDEKGNFLIRDVSPGRYVVRAQKSGYLAPLDSKNPETSAARQNPGRNLEKWSWEGGPSIATQTISVDQDQRAAEVTVSLVRAGTLTGKVRDEDKKPASYIPVQIGAVIQDLNGATLVRPLTAVNTNANGDYRFRLPPGEYLVFVGVPQGASPSVLVQDGNGNAARISVREGEETTSADITFRPPSP